MKTQATPRKWKSDYDSEGIYVIDSRENIICCFHDTDQEYEDDKANAELIVKAVNMHDELVDALTNCRQFLTNDEDAQKFKEEIHKLLAKARETK